MPDIRALLSETKNELKLEEVAVAAVCCVLLFLRVWSKSLLLLMLFLPPSRLHTETSKTVLL